MTYKYIYKTPKEFSDMIMNSDGEYLTGLWFENSRDSSKHQINCEEKDLKILEKTSKWLDIYFSGKVPSFTPKYKIENLTLFRQEIIDEMLRIPYGQVVTYNDISKTIAKKMGIERMSAQTVGGAVGWNPICVIIPCHRVVGTNNSLIGYGGGINNKLKLLELEGIDISKYFVSTKGTAL